MSIRIVLATVLGAGVGAVAMAASTLPRLHRHYTPAVAYADLNVVMGFQEEPEASATVPILCWGDSLTEAPDVSPGHDFPAVLRNVFRRRAINRGVAAQTSAQVKARMLSGGDPAGPSDAIVWVGRNDDAENPDDTLRNIAAMVGSLSPGSHYLVLGVINRDTARERRGGDLYGRIVALNQRLAAVYGAHYLPIREILIARADAASVDDEAAVEADVVPPSLRTDALHLDDQGEAFVAVAIESAIRRGGW